MSKCASIILNYYNIPLKISKIFQYFLFLKIKMPYFYAKTLNLMHKMEKNVLLL